MWIRTTARSGGGTDRPRSFFQAPSHTCTQIVLYQKILLVFVRTFLSSICAIPSIFDENVSVRRVNSVKPMFDRFVSFLLLRLRNLQPTPISRSIIHSLLQIASTISPLIAWVGEHLFPHFIFTPTAFRFVAYVWADYPCKRLRGTKTKLQRLRGPR